MPTGARRTDGAGASALPRVALDAMGGDFAPAETVKGAVEAARKGIAQVLLVGDQPVIEAELKKHDTKGLPLRVVPSEGFISDNEHPVTAMRKKPKASVLVTAGLVKAGHADAAVSMGSTGASMAAATLVMGLLPGLDRPALGGNFLGLAPRTVILDLGSNVDCRARALLDFAVLGAAYARAFLKIESPRVALLSTGAEEAKGNRQVQEAIPVFKASGLNFVGNVEGMDVFTDRADVIVCDGFVGNVLMKFAEGMGTAVGGLLKRELVKSMPKETVEALAQKLWDSTNRAHKSGGPLFGVNGIIVVGHGAARGEGIAGSIQMARWCLEAGLADAMRQDLARAAARLKE